MSAWQHSDHPREQPESEAAADETKQLEREIDQSLRRADHAVVGPVRKRRVGLLVTAIVLGLLLVLTGALATYLWRTTDEWMAEAHRLEVVATDLAADRDKLGGDLDQAGRDLAATEEQLHQAQDRITTLADEKAQTADEREVARQVAGSVVTVASQLEVCARGQSQLISALEDIASFDPVSVSAFAREVSAACNEALAGSQDIKRQLGIE